MHELCKVGGDYNKLQRNMKQSNEHHTIMLNEQTNEIVNNIKHLSTGELMQLAYSLSKK